MCPGLSVENRRVLSAFQSSFAGSGAASDCAVATAASTCADAFARHASRSAAVAQPRVMICCRASLTQSPPMAEARNAGSM